MQKVDADKLALYVLDALANNESFPPVFPATLTFSADLGQDVNNAVIQMMDEVQIDLNILFTLGDLTEYIGSVPREHQEQLGTIRITLFALHNTFNEACALAHDLLHRGRSNHDRIPQLVANLLEIERICTQVGDVDQGVVRQFEDQVNLTDTHWDELTAWDDLVIIEDAIGQWESQFNQAQDVSPEVAQLANLMNQQIAELNEAIDGFTTMQQRYEQAQSDHQDAVSRFFANDAFGNRELLEILVNYVTPLDIPGYGEGEEVIKTFDTAFVTRHINLFTRMSYLIARYIERYNNQEIQIASDAQVEATIRWTRQQIRELEENPRLGRRRRNGLARRLLGAINSDQPLDRARMNFIGDASFNQLQELVTTTQEQIQISRRFLENPEANQELFDQCFRPDIFTVANQQRLFNVVPKPGFTKKYVTIDNPTCETLLRRAGLHHLIQPRTGAVNTIRHIVDLRKVRCYET